MAQKKQSTKSSKVATTTKVASKASSSKKGGAKWAKNVKEASSKAKAKYKAMNQEDAYASRSSRIRDIGQAVPKGYMRTGGRYFVKVDNMRPINSQTTQAQRSLYYSNEERFRKYLRSAGNQGMYNGDTSEANFRKTAGARKLIDADGGTYGPGYGKHAGGKQKKSRYIMAIGQDGHMR